MDDDKENENNYTDARVRRQVRANYRTLANDIEENGEDIVKPESEQLCIALQRTEELFNKVRHPREAVHDSSVLLTLCRKGRQQAQQLKTDIVSFDNSTFTEKIISYLHGRKIANIIAERDEERDVHLGASAWENLGERCAPLFRRAPKFDFLLGPLVIEVVIPPEKQKGRRKLVTEGEVVQLKQLEHVEEQEESTTKEVERIRRMLAENTDGGEHPICFFSFIINPSSFGQTVENLFHLSFLIKDGKASIEINDDGLPLLNCHAEYQEHQHEQVVNRKQVVMPLSIQDWKELIDVYNIKEAMIPTRSC